jgi:hypothetical protein
VQDESFDTVGTSDCTGLTAGVDVRTVAGRLGHRNPATTLNVYAHFVPESDQEAADALGQIFGEAAPGIDDAEKKHDEA